MKWRRAALWLMRRRSGVRMWAIRLGSFYAGYRVLHHEIYETATSEPLLIFLGLWLCGIAPATFFDQLRRIGISLQSELEKEATDLGESLPTPKSELESGEKT